MTKYFVIMVCISIVYGTILLALPRQSAAIQNRICKILKIKTKNDYDSSKKLISRRIKGAIYLLIGVMWFLITGTHLLFNYSGSKLRCEGSVAKDKIAEIVGEYIKERKIPGVVVGVISENGEKFYSQGYSDLDKGSFVTPDTQFEIGSLTKAFTGVLLAKATEDKEVDISSTVGEVLPEMDTGDIKKITLTELCTHTSGLPRVIFSVKYFALSALKTLFLKDPYSFYTDAYVMDYLRNMKIPEEKKFGYSNLGTGFLGHILAKKRGVNYGKLISERILKPFGMSRSGLIPMSENVAKGYAGFYCLVPFSETFSLPIVSEGEPWDMSEILKGAGALRSTGRDMVKFLKHCISGDSGFRVSVKPLFKVSDNFSMGMFWGLYRSKSFSETLVFHDGETGGFKSFMGIFPEQKTGVVILTNTTKDVRPLGVKILKTLQKEGV